MTFFAPKKQEAPVQQAEPLAPATQPVSPTEITEPSAVKRKKTKSQTLLTGSSGIDETGARKTLLG